MILYFTGTGNTYEAALKLSERIDQKCVCMDPALLNEPFEIEKGEEMVIWMCPVYSWGIPPYVRRFMACVKCEEFGNLIHHLVLTCGDDCGKTPEMWRRDAAKRAWKCGNVYTIIMPNNYVCMKGFDVDSPELQEEKLKALEKRVEHIAADLKAYSSNSESKDDVTRGKFAGFKTSIIYPWFVRHAMSPRPFHYTEECISCGKCSTVCPMRNIEMINDDGNALRPHWGADCAGCLACYHICPVHAVQYGKSTLRKGQYFNAVYRSSLGKRKF